MPEGAVYVGRPSKWGNPFSTKVSGSPERAVEDYRIWLRPETRSSIREHLAGKDLACWCRLDQPCHADVLLEIANSTETKEGGNDD